MANTPSVVSGTRERETEIFRSNNLTTLIVLTVLTLLTCVNLKIYPSCVRWVGHPFTSPISNVLVRTSKELRILGSNSIKIKSNLNLIILTLFQEDEVYSGMSS